MLSFNPTHFYLVIQFMSVSMTQREEKNINSINLIKHSPEGAFGTQSGFPQPNYSLFLLEKPKSNSLSLPRTSGNVN